MNFRHLRKNLGQALLLRPIAQRLAGDGARLPPNDDYWRLDSILQGPDRIRLVHIVTGLSVELQPDNVQEYRSPEFLLLKCQLTSTPTTVLIEPLVPVRGLPGNPYIPPDPLRASPAPIARYQAQKRRATNEYVPAEPQVCDGCGIGVQFRPLITLTLPAQGDWPMTREQFCPPCARKRGHRAQIPRGMTEDVVYADQNPSLKDHLSRLLKHPILPALCERDDLRALGLASVGAVLDGTSVSLIISGPEGGTRETEIALETLDRDRILSETALLDRFAAAIRAALAT
jgi:hypothetical protein